MRTIKFYTLGCKVNQYETQEIREKFLGCGFKEPYNAKMADIYLINTCTVTQRADSRSLNLLRRAGRENPRAKIIVTGCLTELDQNKIKETARDCLIIRNKDKENILSFFNQRTSEPANQRTTKGISYFAGHARAFLKIQDGCDNFCSYCKVPRVRGRPKSKPVGDIINEAGRLVESGCKEIVLTGICSGSYGRDLSPQKNIVEAIEALEKINGLLRIRLSSIEPQDITGGLIKRIAHSSKLCRHLHIPLQSGDDTILKKMNRKYTTAKYLKLIQRIKKRIPGIAITTDVMVGFPGENEESFHNTKELVKKIMPLKAHIFPYSRRKSTAAAHFNNQLSPPVIKRRISCLKLVADACSFKYRNQFLGRRMDGLIERRSKENPSFWEGYTDNYLKILVKSKSDLRNQLIPLFLKKMKGEHILSDLCHCDCDGISRSRKQSKHLRLLRFAQRPRNDGKRLLKELCLTNKGGSGIRK